MDPFVLSLVGLALAVLLLFVAASRIRKEGLVPVAVPQPLASQKLLGFTGAVLLVDARGRNGRALVKLGGRTVRAIVRDYSHGGKHVRVANLRRRPQPSAVQPDRSGRQRGAPWRPRSQLILLYVGSPPASQSTGWGFSFFLVIISHIAGIV